MVSSFHRNLRLGFRAIQESRDLFWPLLRFLPPPPHPSNILSKHSFVGGTFYQKKACSNWFSSFLLKIPKLFKSLLRELFLSQRSSWTSVALGNCCNIQLSIGEYEGLKWTLKLCNILFPSKVQIFAAWKRLMLKYFSKMTIKKSYQMQVLL